MYNKDLSETFKHQNVNNKETANMSHALHKSFVFGWNSHKHPKTIRLKLNSGKNIEEPAIL